MRIGIVSDLHLEFSPYEMERGDVDVSVNAGDVHPDPDIQVKAAKVYDIVVPGNHDYYYGKFPEQDSARGVLERDGVKFAWATLWTQIVDIDLWTRYAVSLNDYRCIEGMTLGKYQNKFAGDLEFLRNAQADVVVTHHSPFTRSIAKEYSESSLNYCFHSDLEKWVDTAFIKKPKLWIHGHTHSPCDYVTESGIRVVCHPRGYPNEKSHRGYEMKVVEL